MRNLNEIKAQHEAIRQRNHLRGLEVYAANDKARQLRADRQQAWDEATRLIPAVLAGLAEVVASAPQPPFVAEYDGAELEASYRQGAL